MSITVLRQILMKEAVKKAAGSSGIMTINKNITKEVEQLLQKYINDAMQQGVDLNTLSPERLKMIVAMNRPKITPTLNKDANIYSKQYIDNLDKEIVDSGLYTKKEWANLSDDLKEARRRNFDSNYDDAMEGMVENNVIPLPMKRTFKQEIDAMKKSGDIVDVDDIKISEKITDREMFKNSNLNKPTIEGQMEKITGASNRIKEIQKEIDEMYRPKTDAEIKAKFERQNKEAAERLRKKQKEAMDDMKEIEDPEEFAKGGRIGFRAGKFVLDKIIAKLLGDPKKVKQAADDIFPTGDYKYDAQMAAEALVENNPRIFKNKLYDDLDLDTQLEIYGAVLEPIQKNMSMAIKMKKASRPEKTLAAMKEGKGIDMSDPAIADEFTRFMKETDPQGSKTIEQTVELANFDPKKVKGNAEGGRIGYQTGNQVMPAVDARMNLDYNTLVDQNTAQRVAQAQNRNPVLQRMQNVQNAPSALETLGNLYNKQGIMDAQSKFLREAVQSDPQAYEKTGSGLASDLRHKTASAQLRDTLGGGITGQVAANVLGGIREIPQLLTGDFKGVGEDLKANFQGARDVPIGLTPQESYDYLIAQQQVDPGVVDPTVDQDRISEIIEQQKAAGVPDEGLITNFQQDDGSSVIPNFEKLSDGSYKDTRSGDIYGAETYGSIAAGMYPNIYDPNNYNKEENEAKPITSADYSEDYKGPMLMNQGGRAGYYTGGITDVEPRLDDIGHGSDSLMSRTRLMSPGAQATTSTGLNYLLAEDNDNLRIPFGKGGLTDSDYLKVKDMLDHWHDYKKSGKPRISKADFARAFFRENNAEGGRIGFAGGGDPKRRLFLKLMAALGGATAAVKSGIIGLGEGTGKKAVSETVKKSAGSGTPPPYFFKLVEKIKTMGDDTLPSQDKVIAKKYKDYVMEEDFAGNIEIMKKNKNISEDVYMSYKVDEVPTKIGKKKSTKVEEYEEFTATPDAEGKMKNIEQGVPDEVVQEGTMFEDNMTEFGKTKKADGGRIGYVGGGLSKLGITGSSRRFLEKVFGKEKFKNLIENDPELHRGLLEVAEMFRSKDKSGLVEYMQNFLPQMSKKELEAFVVGSGDTAGIEGQLIRLGSGRDYKNKIEMIEESNNLRKLKDFDVEGVSKNADGGRIGFSGGGIIRAIIANSAKKKGMSVTDFIKATNYKGLPPEVKMFLSAEDFAKLKSGQKEMYDNYIDMAKTRLEFQKNIEGGKNTPARELFEGMEKTMDEQSMVPKNVTSDDIAEMELMVKNRFNKGRKDNAKGGLQTMLGE